MGMEDRVTFPQVNSTRPPRITGLDAVKEQRSWRDRVFSRNSFKEDSNTNVVDSLKSFLPSISKWRKVAASKGQLASDSLKPTPPPSTGPTIGEATGLRRVCSDPRKHRLLQNKTNADPPENEEGCERKERSTSLPGTLHRTAQPPEARMIELVPGELHFALHATEEQTRQLIVERPDLFVFSSVLHEYSHCRAFGTPDLGVVYSFWKHVQSKAMHPKLNGRQLVYYSDFNELNKGNAAFLLGAYLMLQHSLTAAEATSRVEEMGPYVVSFCAASKCRSGMTLRDYLDGLSKAIGAGWFGTASFDAADYEWLRLSGDMSALCGKFMAFRGPDDTELTASFYAGKLKARGVEAVVRLNDANTYYAEHFEQRGLAHHHLFFPDGSNPSPDIIQSFLDICDATPGQVGVHCMAGLGRTGTLICLWMMRTLGWSAREAVAWARIVRPGSVIGPQQAFLLRCDAASWDGHRLHLGPASPPDSPATILQLGRAPSTPRASAAADGRSKRLLKGEGAGVGWDELYAGRRGARMVRSW